MADNFPTRIDNQLPTFADLATQTERLVDRLTQAGLGELTAHVAAIQKIAARAEARRPTRRMPIGLTMKTARLELDAIGDFCARSAVLEGRNDTGLVGHFEHLVVTQATAEHWDLEMITLGHHSPLVASAARVPLSPFVAAANLPPEVMRFNADRPWGIGGELLTVRLTARGAGPLPLPTPEGLLWIALLSETRGAR